MQRLTSLLLLFTALTAVLLPAYSRQTIPLQQWLFSRDSVVWEAVTVPHDWAISGPFDKKWDLQTVAIAQNGEQQATEKSGRSGALPWIGDGFYTTTVPLTTVPQYAELFFDGAMREPRVYVNGTLAGSWAYGYNAFRIDITPFLHSGDNTIAVHLTNCEASSRWYPGAGLYRPVQLILSNDIRIADWETFIYTQSIASDSASLVLNAALLNTTPSSVLSVEIRDERGKEAYHADISEGLAAVEHSFILPKALLWSPETPHLYSLHLTLRDGGSVVDEQSLRFGVRTIAVSAEHGFQLNGVSRKIKGVCLHHDLGPLGTAVNKAALIRQVRILKDMGCDAVRTSHNMPSSMQMEVYDSLGMMVMVESFDAWRYPKCENDYNCFFDEWWQRDVTNMLLNHRNHPSNIMWSIGNEIPEQGSAEGLRLSQELQSLCHKLDPSRPVTQGLDQVRNALASGVAAVMDIPGLNYRAQEYLNAYTTLPQGYILGSETASTISSRGIYKFPVVVEPEVRYADGQCNSYDVESCWWSNLPEVDFALQDDYPWTIGQFVWTGFDYLGEPTPYDEYWPSRSSYFGICDLAGLPKDRYWLYRSQWNSREHTVHLLPHWSWRGREGELTPVYCYTDGVEGELFVNGKSQGRVRKDYSRHIQDICPDSVNVQPLLDRYRLRWNDVRYEEGEIHVVVYDANGAVIGEDTRYTPSAPAAIHFASDRQTLHADGDDLCFLTLSLVDKDGHDIPDATDEIHIAVEGQGTFRAMCNGDATSLEPFTTPTMHLFSGKVVVVVQAGTMRGTVRVVATDATNALQGTYEIEVI